MGEDFLFVFSVVKFILSFAYTLAAFHPLAPMRATYTNVENGFGLVGGCCLRQTEWMELSESETQLDFDHAVFNVEYNVDSIKKNHPFISLNNESLSK